METLRFTRRHRLTPVEEREELFCASLLPTNYRAAFREAMRECAQMIACGDADGDASFPEARLGALEAFARYAGRGSR